MPVYEYLCEKCGHVTEALRRMADADGPQACEKCGSKKCKRAQSVFAPGGSGAAAERSLPMSCGMGGGGCCGGGACGHHHH